MPAGKINIEKFLTLSEHFPVLDVRSPGEFLHAHFPKAISFPLFTDDERKIVGTAYKQQSREAAIKTGLDFFGVKMRKMVEEAEEIISKQNPAEKSILVHCWRGGMRSTAIAWLLDLYGFKVYTLAGGYKAFRNWVLQQFNKQYNLKIVGGYTGSGKTYILKEIEKSGNLIIDLEKLANHKGSAFGALGQPQQPSQEMFENLLAVELVKVLPSGEDLGGAAWLEDESERIGRNSIPKSLWKQMRNSPVHFFNIPFEQRLSHLVNEYGNFDKQILIECVLRIQKRLGGLETKNAIQFLEDNNIKESFRILLTYYDRWYKKGLYNRDNAEALITTIISENVDAVVNAKKILLQKTSA